MNFQVEELRYAQLTLECRAMSGQKSNSRERPNMIGSERTNISLYGFVKITASLLSNTSVASHGSIQTYIQRCHGEDSLLGIYRQVARGWQTHPSLTSDLPGRTLHNTFQSPLVVVASNYRLVLRSQEVVVRIYGLSFCTWVRYASRSNLGSLGSVITARRLSVCVVSHSHIAVHIP